MIKNIIIIFYNEINDFSVFCLIKKLEELKYIVFIFESEISKRCIPAVLNDKYFSSYENEKKYDLYIILKNNYDKKIVKNIEIEKIIKKNNLNYLEISKKDILENIEKIVKNINLKIDRIKKLENYSFLITAGSFLSNLDDQHYIGCYNRKDLTENIIKKIALQGANSYVIIKSNKKINSYANETIYINTLEEYKIIFKSKSFKYDIIIDSIKIPRFGLPKNEKIKIEYNRYFAELKETYLFLKDQEISKNQIIIRFFDGYEIPEETIKYYFKNTEISAIFLNEIDKKTNNYSKFLKIYTREQSCKIIFYDNLDELINLIIQKSINILEGK